MNTIDVTTITHVKYANSDTPWEAVLISVKPDTGASLTNDLGLLFQARYVRVLEEWVDLLGGDPGLGNTNPQVNIKDGTENDSQLPGDPNTVSHLQMWGFYFPEGEYLFDNVVLRNQVYVVGSGSGTVFKSVYLPILTAQSPNVTSQQVALIKPIFTHPTGEHLRFCILENLTFEDAHELKFVADELVIRNCRFYNMNGGAIDISKSKQILLENNFVGFNPNTEENGAYEYHPLEELEPSGSIGEFVRNDKKSTTGMGFYSETISGAGQSQVVIQNNYFEYTGDNCIGVRGLKASEDLPVTLEASGVLNIRISNNRIYKAGKAGIKLTYEGGGHLSFPYGQLSCHVINNQIREWGIFKPEAAITCDNDASFIEDENINFQIPSEESDLYLSGIPTQEIDLPYMFLEETDDEDFGYNEHESELPILRETYHSYSAGLTLHGNQIIGSGRARLNPADRNEAYGITARKWKSITISSNLITGTPLFNTCNIHIPSGSTTRSGIQLNDCSEFTIVSNVIINPAYVYISEMPANKELENDTRGGIKLIGSMTGTITGNTIKNPGTIIDPEFPDRKHKSQGILLWNSRFVIVSSNIMIGYNPKHLYTLDECTSFIKFVTMEHGVKEAGDVNDEFNRCASNTIVGNRVFFGYQNLNYVPYLILEEGINSTKLPLDKYYGLIDESDIV